MSATKEDANETDSPTEIVNEVLSRVNLCCSNTTQRYQLASIEEAKSAQQRVFILKFVLESFTEKSTEKAKASGLETSSSTLGAADWRDALENGGNQLVLRIWKGGSQWWNFHQNANHLELAIEEVMGYKVARQALTSIANVDVPRIPQVLMFEQGSKDTKSQMNLTSPWAVLEYVGPGSLHLPMNEVDMLYMNVMVKIREEFGFQEPHPRWGRVPVDQALSYARLVLNQVMVPLHQTTRCMRPTPGMVVQSYGVMVTKYRDAFQLMVKSMAIQQTSVHPEMMNVVSCLSGALQVLEGYCDKFEGKDSTHPSGMVTDMAPVLVHMDLQPQNLIFGKSDANPIIGSHQCKVHSVLDWEDAAWGDPRFDVLLLCRKVCANAEQAEKIWAEYEIAMSKAEKNLANGKNESSKLGPILPWLQLETVHSLTTLLLQSMDLLNGGRNPWETKKDLWGKLEREVLRWEAYNT